MKKFYAFHVNPLDVFIVGLDTKHDESHPLWDSRIHDVIPEEHVLSAYNLGVREPVSLIEVEGEHLVLAGRHRTMGLREANDRRAKDGLEPLTMPATLEKPPTGKSWNLDNPKHRTLLLMLLARENLMRTDPTPIEAHRSPQEGPPAA